MTPCKKIHTIPNNVERQEAAQTIQRVWQGHQVRSIVAFPENLHAFLQDATLNMTEDNITATAELITLHLFKIQQNPLAYYGEGVKLKKSRHIYRDRYGTTRTLERTLRIRLRPDGRTVRIQVYATLFAKGSYKDVRYSQTLVVRIKNECFKFLQNEDTVLVRTCNYKKRNANSEVVPRKVLFDQDLMIVERGLAIMSRLFPKSEREKYPNLMLCGIPDVVYRLWGKERAKLEWEETRYPCTLASACKIEKMSIGESEPLGGKFNTDDKIRIIELLVYTVEKMHSKGIVHADIKPSNIQIKWNTDTSNTKGLLRDYEMVSYFGSSSFQEDYHYWDLCAKRGELFPPVDYIGADRALGYAIFSSNYPKAINNAHNRCFPPDVKKVIDGFLGTYINRRLVRLVKNTSIPKLFRGKIRKHISHVGNVPANVASIREVFDAIIQCDSKLQKTILKTLADCTAAEKIAQLSVELNQANIVLFFYLFENNDGKKIRARLNDPNISSEEKLQIFKTLLLNYPIFGEYKDRLKKIRMDWEKLVDSC